nr:DUF2723 domain-containing protein [candidate division Zixibacteria bacterium]
MDKTNSSPGGFDKINAIIGGLVLIFSLIVYQLTVAPTLSYWDCGEFIACSHILGIPHPPGSPLFIVIGRIFSVLPLVSDICMRINLISVITSAIAVLFGYLSVVRMIRFWHNDMSADGWSRIITYLGGVTGALFMAFSTTYWGNAVEAEVYGMSLMLMTIILWLMLKYYNVRGTMEGTRIIILACYLALLGVAVHLTTFLIMPVAAIFFILKKDSPPKAWIILCCLFVAELLAIFIFSNMEFGYQAFLFASVLMMMAVVFFTFRYINWPVLIGIGAFSLIMIGFYQFIYGLLAGLIVMLVIAFVARKLDWRTGLVIIILAVVGYSFHLFIPIRSGAEPNLRIDENNPSRDFSIAPWAFFDGKNKAFINYLDRKQYGSELMVERSFKRRGTWAHQFGRHPHMGFWSYFEEQYGLKSIHLIIFIIGLFGTAFAIMRRLEVGLPFLILLLLASVGLVLYMNFADGIKYNPVSGDAYLEVRNRDYFFTPAFAFFGLAIGLGLAALMEVVRKETASKSYQKPLLAIMSLLVLLPGFPLANNYFCNDRSKNYYPLIYSQNILNTCKENAILFTSGDNDTFPLWCVQEVYDHRKDVRVVNLSLFNTDWYVEQMKNRYGVPISLSDDQILWNDYEYRGQTVRRPEKPFYDRPRKRRTYLIPMPFEGRTVKLQDMMVDEVVLENKWRDPVYFSSEPYAESPLKLRDISVATGILYRLDTANWPRGIDAEEGSRLYHEVYRYDGLDDPTIYRDENATGVMMTLGFNALRIANEFHRTDRIDRAKEILTFIIGKYPEFLQAYAQLSDYYKAEGDSAAADSILAQFEGVVKDLLARDPQNQFYLGDLGLVEHYRGRSEDGVQHLWDAFRLNMSNGHAYHKLAQTLFETRRMTDLYNATMMYADYKNNMDDPLVRQIMGSVRQQSPIPGTP